MFNGGYENGSRRLFIGMVISLSLTPFYYIFVEILDKFYQAFRSELSEE